MDERIFPGAEPMSCVVYPKTADSGTSTKSRLLTCTRTVRGSDRICLSQSGQNRLNLPSG